MADPDTSFAQLLASAAKQIPLELSSPQIADLRRHYELLQKWNRRINLTGIREPRQIVERHFGESLFLAKILPEAETVIDVGSGAGFPGLPLAVARREMRVTLVESIWKKATFLKEVARPLGNVRVHHGRVEELADQFDCAVCRAVVLDQVLAQLRRIAERVGLLTSQGSLPRLLREENIDWGSAVALPWGEQRVVLLGSFRGRSST